MTHTEFWNLYDNDKLENVKTWRRKEDIDTEGDFDCNEFFSEIISFVYENKYYLRIVQFNGYHVRFVGRRGHREAKRDGVKTWSVIKEFDSKSSANAYFKKCAVGYSIVH